jgi:hypothetical protein
VPNQERRPNCFDKHFLERKISYLFALCSGNSNDYRLQWIGEVGCTLVDASSGSGLASARRTRRAVGAVAIALLLLFTVLAFIRIFSLLEWLIGDVAVALVANLIFRWVGRKTKQ